MPYWMASIFWVAIGIFIVIQAYLLRLGSFHQPGPGFIFFLAGLILTVLSIIDLIVAFFEKSKIEKAEKVWAGVQWGRVLLVLGVLSAYLIFINALGFLVSTFLLMVFLFKGIEPTKWWIAVISALVATLVAYCLFRVWLGVPFPRGLLGV